MTYPKFTGTEPCTEVGVAAFFVEDGENENATIGAARRICTPCPMQAECLEWALALPERHGIWGGFTTQERERMRRSRRIKPAAA